MGHFVKCFTKIQEDCVDLMTRIQSFRPVTVLSKISRLRNSVTYLYTTHQRKINVRLLEGFNCTYQLLHMWKQKCHFLLLAVVEMCRSFPVLFQGTMASHESVASYVQL